MLALQEFHSTSNDDPTTLFKHIFSSQPQGQTLDEDTPETVIELKTKPVNITRNVMLMYTANKVPIIRDIIVIETEASSARILERILSYSVLAIIVLLVTNYWKRVHSRSCNFITNVVLFTFPVVVSFLMEEYVFVLCTLILFVRLGLIYREVCRRPIRAHTPKMAHNFFTLAYRVSYIVTYISVLFLFISYFLCAEFTMFVSLYIFSYGVYFGLIVRESINIIGDMMASNIGCYSKQNVSEKSIGYNTCALCDESASNLIMLACKHQYHETCIKGWLLMGKRSFCPCCRENVDLNRLCLNFWDKNDSVYGQMVDILRCFVIVIFALIIFSLFSK